MKKIEVEFVEALRKVGFSGTLCESINNIRKVIFENEEELSKDQVFQKIIEEYKRTRDIDVFDEFYYIGKGRKVVEIEGKFNVIDKEGNLLLNKWLDNIDYDVETDGDYKVELNGKYTLMDENGKLIGDGNKWFDDIELYSYRDGYSEYDSHAYFKNGHAAVELGGKWSLIDENGNLLSDKFDEIDMDTDFGGRYTKWSIGYTKVKLNGKYSLIDENGELFGNGEKWFDEIEPWDGYIKVKLNGKENFINEDGEPIGGGWFDYIAGCHDDHYSKVKLNNKWSWIDKYGKLIGDGKKWFDDVVYFYEGYSKVELNGKYSFIDENGELIGDGDRWFDEAKSFQGGCALVKLNGKYNFIGKDGEPIWKGEQWFDRVKEFSEGYAKVMLDWKWYKLDKNGELHDMTKSQGTEDQL